MNTAINSVYLKSSPKAQISRLCESTFNTIIVSFLTFSPAGDVVADGAMADYRPSEWIDLLHAAGKKILFSIGGEFLKPADLDFLFVSPSSTLLQNEGYEKLLKTIRAILSGESLTLHTLSGQQIVSSYGDGFDGIDFDLENFDSYTIGPNSDFWAERLSALNLTLRRDLGTDVLLTHAPQTPYILSASLWPTAHGANRDALYSRVMQLSGDALSWLNIQLHNQGNYTVQAMLNNTMAALLDWSRAMNTSAQKIVLTLPLSPDECGSGYVSPEMLKMALETIHADFGGFNGWSFSSNEAVHPSWDQQFSDILELAVA